jgi:hypothetical protein
MWAGACDVLAAVRERRKNFRGFIESETDWPIEVSAGDPPGSVPAQAFEPHHSA